ncbi:cardiotrophin-1 isoform X2 [Ambystoma mexicanum]|uniref:cardiotrophin-1 isoform X2 n=1 Tax=Ambystoma mexicanum TaxID=8296 RepID=UPI0037E78309
MSLLVHRPAQGGRAPGKGPPAQGQIISGQMSRMQNQSLKPETTHCEGKATPVERASRLTTQSDDLAKKVDFAKKIDQAQRQVVLLKSRSEILLREYLVSQEEPFGQPDFIPPARLIPGLPSPDISPEAWIGLTDAERLRQNYTAYAVLPDHLHTVLLWQRELNPRATHLLELLESAILQAQGLDSNLAVLLQTVGCHLPTVPAPPKLSASNHFQEKVSGYNVCRVYHQWICRTERDFGLMAKKYPL